MANEDMMLVRDYARHNSEAAFAALVRQHTNSGFRHGKVAAAGSEAER